MDLLVLAYYRYAPLSGIRFRIHLFIVVEATLALALVAYGIALQARVSKSSARAVAHPHDDSVG
jgi:hypothetical protein